MNKFFIALATTTALVSVSSFASTSEHSEQKQVETATEHKQQGVIISNVVSKSVKPMMGKGSVQVCFTIKNTTEHEVKLTAAATNVADKVTVGKENKVVVIPAGQEVTLNTPENSINVSGFKGPQSDFTLNLHFDPSEFSQEVKVHLPAGK